MRLDLLGYGVVDGLAPEGRCMLHIHDAEQVAENRATNPSVAWAPFTERILKPIASRVKRNDGMYAVSSSDDVLLDSSSADVPSDLRASVAIFGAEVAPHPLLPRLRSVTFTRGMGESESSKESTGEKRGKEEERKQEASEEHFGGIDAAAPVLPGADTCTHYQCVATHLAGLVAAKASKAMTGIAEDVDLINLCVMDRNGGCSTGASIAALKYAVEQRVTVICIPLCLKGFLEPSASAERKVFSALLDKAISNGSFVVAATGDACESFPADLPTVCSVTAFSKQHDFSYVGGGELTLADIAVPGEGLWSLHPTINAHIGGSRSAIKEKGDGGLSATELGYSRLTGVAMATALFAGFAARMAVYHGAPVPSADGRFIQQFSDMLRAGPLNTAPHTHPLRESQELNRFLNLPNKRALHSTSSPASLLVDSPTGTGEGVDLAASAEEIELHTSSGVVAVVAGGDEVEDEEESHLQPFKRFFSLYPRYTSPESVGQDEYLQIRENQKRKDALLPGTAQLQPYDLIDVPYDDLVELGDHFKPAATFGLLDWALCYFAPYPDTDPTVEEPIRRAPTSQFQLEALAVTLQAGSTGQQLRQVLWRTLKLCKGICHEDWCIIPDHTASPVPTIEEMVGRSGGGGEGEPQGESVRPKLRKRFLVLTRPSTRLQCPWEFCRQLSIKYAKVVLDAEPLFLEVESHTNIFSGSAKSSDPLYSAEEFLGIPTIEEDLSTLASDVTVAHISSGYQEHECLKRANVMYSRGWDYTRHEDFSQLSDLWTNCETPEFGSTTGATGLASISILLGAEGSSNKGVAPNVGIVPIRAHSQREVRDGGSKFKSYFLTYKSPVRVGMALSHAIRVRADVVIFDGALVCHHFEGYLCRLLALACQQNVVVVAGSGNGMTYKGKMVYPPGGAMSYPSRSPSTIGVAGCTIDEVPWTVSCRGPQAATCSLAEYLIVASDKQRESSPGSGTCGGASTVFSAATVAGLAALFLSRHGKSMLVKTFCEQGIALHQLFEFILQHAQHTPASWSYVTCKVFGGGTVKRQAKKFIRYPLPTITELQSFAGTRKRVTPRVLMLDFTGPKVTIHLKRELIYLYSTLSVLFHSNQKGAHLYRLLLSKLSVSASQELAFLITSSPNVTDNKLSIVADGFFVSSQGQVHSITKKTNMIKKATRDHAPVAAYYPSAPSGAWRSVFYVGLDNEIHQLYWYQSILHWGMELYYQTLTTTFKNAKAKTTSPVAFHSDDTSFYSVFYVGDQDNRIHLLASYSQTQTWKHSVPAVKDESDQLVFVHPDSIGLQRYPRVDGCCLAFTALHDRKVHHIRVISTKKCDLNVPHHTVDLNV